LLFTLGLILEFLSPTVNRLLKNKTSTYINFSLHCSALGNASLHTQEVVNQAKKEKDNVKN
jgi:hypothetical protein